MVESSLNWDGTFLGTFKRSIIIHKDKNLYTLDYNNTQYKVSMYRNLDNFQSIVDDIKPIFGLNSNGYHTLIIGRLNYVIFKEVTGITLGSLLKNNKIRNNVDFKSSVRKILLFRHLLALSKSTENTIMVKNNQAVYVPDGAVSELSKKVDDDFKILSAKTYNSWFDEKFTLTDQAKEIIGDNRYNHVIFEIQEKLEKIVRKHNVEYMWYSSAILGRLQGCL